MAAMIIMEIGDLTMPALYFYRELYSSSIMEIKLIKQAKTNAKTKTFIVHVLY